MHLTRDEKDVTIVTMRGSTVELHQTLWEIPVPSKSSNSKEFPKTDGSRD